MSPRCYKDIIREWASPMRLWLFFRRLLFEIAHKNFNRSNVIIAFYALVDYTGVCQSLKQNTVLSLIKVHNANKSRVHIHVLEQPIRSTLNHPTGIFVCPDVWQRQLIMMG